MGAGAVRCRCRNRPRSGAVKERMYNMLSLYHPFRHLFFLGAVVVLVCGAKQADETALDQECEEKLVVK